jgi:DNA-directed RNA polymerase subunit RPC12/RpoP
MSNLNLNPKQFSKYNSLEEVPPVKTRAYLQCDSCGHEGEFNSVYHSDANVMSYKCHKCKAEHDVNDWFEEHEDGGDLAHPDNPDKEITTKNLHTALSKPSAELPSVPKSML